VRRLTVKTITQHDQPDRDKAVPQHFDIAPLARIVQRLQLTIRNNTQARQLGRPLPAPPAQTGHHDSQRQLHAARQGREINGKQRQHRHSH